jgi:mannosylfructose-phosphate synthase
MRTLSIDKPQAHAAFLASPARHILMLSTHGIHQQEIIPGLPDTGGQNLFVNQLSDTLRTLGFKITIANRGGYDHPVSGLRQEGIHYQNGHQRILYLEDGLSRFVRKEEMQPQTTLLAQDLLALVSVEQLPIHLLISHYWDAALIAETFCKHQLDCEHIWIPHSLGSIKKSNVAPEQWSDLNIDKRIEIEASLLHSIDIVAATSSRLSQALLQDYKYQNKIVFLPPNVDPERFYPRTIEDNDPIWNFLSQHCTFSPSELRKHKIITEISRTDTTKRKDVLIKSVARVREKFPNTLLVTTIDPINTEVAQPLLELIDITGMKEHTIVLGTVTAMLPSIYAVSSIYCTPSIMEGFGMAVQEAAATQVPIVASSLVPFAVEYLLGDTVQEIPYGNDGKKTVRRGNGALVVPPDEIEGYASALMILLADPALRSTMGENAYEITIPRFTWLNQVHSFLNDISHATSKQEKD